MKKILKHQDRQNTFPKMWHLGLLGSLSVLLSGCGEDTAIRSYSVAKNSPGQTESSPERPTQLLGVIVPHQESAWFLKLTDEPEKVQKIAEDFRHLASSLKFKDDGTPQWELAEGWNEKVLRQMTYAQFSNPDGATVTLTQLGANTQDAAQWQSYLRDNINRWRGQLGLAPLDWPSIEPELEEVPSHSTETAKAYFVSLIGRQSSAGGSMRPGGPPMLNPSQTSTDAPSSSPASESAPISRPQLVYEVPEGWQEQPSSGIRLAFFHVSEGSPDGIVTVSAAGGKIEQSIGMWLQQVGSEPDESLVQKVVEESIEGKVELGSYRCYLINPESGTDGSEAIAIRAVVLPMNEGESLFIKMTGTPKTVAAESQKMDQFVASLRWQ